MAETVPGILFSCDAHGAPEYVNARFAEITGLRGDTAEAWTDALHPEDRPHVRAGWDRAVREAKPFDVRCRLRTPGDRYRWFQVRARPIHDRDRVVNWFGVCADVDDLVRAEQALVEADRRKDQFVVTLAHELRNPLAPMTDALTYLDRVPPGSAEAAHAHDLLKRQLTHLGRIVDDLLDLSRISRGSLWLRREPLDLSELVRSVAEDHRRVLQRAGIELWVEVPPTPRRLVGDRTRLSQVLRNLLQNANKFTDGGGRVTVVLREVTDGREAQLEVRDTGIGIVPEMLDQVFDPFRQASTRSPEGVGLGLALVKGVVELHGGTVQASSRGLGEGTTIVVRLPLQPDATPPVAGPSRHEQAAPQVPRRVLLVEDEPDAAAMLEALLALDGHRVEVCPTAEVALQRATELVPEIVLCDIGLRGEMDGYDVARALRARAELRSALLIALTGYGQEEDQRRAHEAGFDHHLAKPADYDALLELFSAWSARRG